MSLLGKILRTGRVTQHEDATPTGEREHTTALGGRGGSVQIRHVDAGSCNGCELEVGAAFGPVYDAERFGVRLVASPRHADALLVTGPVTKNMAVPLRKTYDATPAPKLVIALGDCAVDCAAFKGAYGVEGPVGDVVPVEVSIPGCPPDPDAILRALRTITQR